MYLHWELNMAHISDYKRDSMQTVLGSSVTNIDDLEILYLQSLGATSDQVNEAWKEVFDANGASSDNWNDAAQEFLTSVGGTSDNLPDNWNWFWVKNGGVLADNVVNGANNVVNGADNVVNG